MNKGSRRLMRELEELIRTPPAGIRLLSHEDLYCWLIQIEGAPGTLYEGETFKLKVAFCKNYPIESPEVIFVDNIPLHEHVYSNGHICLSILYDAWSPILTVSSLALSILSMLSSSKEKRFIKKCLVDLSCKSASVKKSIPLDFDTGHLAATDIHFELEAGQGPGDHHATSLETALLSQTRDNAQLFINELFQLPTTTDEEGVKAKLPPPKLALPRARAVPVPQPKTKWEKFAEKKHISKASKEFSMVYDENRKEYLPRYGSKSAKNDPLSHWIEELPS